MSASGFVFNITLSNPISHAPLLTLHSKFNIIFITGTFLGSSTPSSSSSANSSSSGGFCSFGITLVGQQGHVLRGVVSGNVTAANKVVPMVVTFISPSFYRLPGADLVVHDGGDDHGNPKLGGAGHGGVGAGATAGASGSEGCSSTNMSISGHGVSSPALLNSLAPSDVVTWDGSTFLPHHLY
ncbi:AT-hook motif nuclear-localized protein 17 [Camellia lanceoleosa]|uniref:AT-hook motif nuclear-localized protein 17 n=1 Tax=Camellia lanceoleosa TaxID=1840588 RepID=A0ACC0G5H8_9ERIC|nr:AT-hook motif nuclear-localized protein 17 [Camellia lanceoleosa]